MKKLFTIIAAALTFAACNTKSDLDTNKDVVLTDTTNMYKSNASTDISSGQAQPVAAPQPIPQPQQPVQTRTIIRERTVYVDRTPKQQTVREATPVSPVVTNVPQPQTNTGTSSQSPGTNDDNSGVGTASTGGIGQGTGTGTGTLPDIKPEKKKGWSNAAKDAVIGGMGGAVGGAIISRRKGSGAIIGGIIGAAGGYILGRKKDKSDNNYVEN